MHLAQKLLAPVCRKLGVDYAPAMTGFSIRGGRSIPDILGVVVCEEHADAVLRGFQQDQRCSLQCLLLSSPGFPTPWALDMHDKRAM